MHQYTPQTSRAANKIQCLPGQNRFISNTYKTFLVLATLSSLLLVLLSGSVSAQNSLTEPLLIPIGGGYNETLPAFSEAAIAHHHRGYVNILVLPITLASDYEDITLTERQQALNNAENLRNEIEAACQQSAGYNYICNAEVVPVLTREDALNSENLDYFTQEISAVYIPEGDANIAMHVIGGTLIEGALIRAHQQNVVIAGTGAGSRIQSVAMLDGYQPGFNQENALHFNSVTIQGDAEKHGLLFGFQHSILDSSFYEDGNLGRLISAIHQPGNPHLGIGIDTGTGFYAPDGQLIKDIFGRTSVMVLDSETYHAANSSRYIGCGDTGTAILPCTPILSTRNVLVNLLAPGEFTYDLNSREHSLDSAKPIVIRDFSVLRLNPGLGTLFLSGGLEPPFESNDILKRFSEVSGGSEGKVLIINIGESGQLLNESSAKRLGAALEMPVEYLSIADGTQSLEIDQTGITGILVTGEDSARISLYMLGSVLEAWRNGTPILLDDIAATLAGEYYIAEAMPPDNLALQGLAASRNFLSDSVSTQPGLSLLSILVEPSLMSENRWGRLFSLAHQNRDYLAVGLNKNTALEINQDGARVVGENAVITLDLRKAQLAIGLNNAMVIANGMLDIFAPGEVVEAVLADTNAAATQAPTPVLITATPTASPTATNSPTPTETPLPTRTPRSTRTPRPTATPPTIPPPSNPSTNQWMIAFSTLVVIVILFGLLINRNRLR